MKVLLSLILISLSLGLGACAPMKPAQPKDKMQRKLYLNQSAQEEWVDLELADLVLPGSLCTAEYKVLKNAELNLCAEALDGCEISVAEKMGFYPAPEGSCEVTPVQ
jgi:hypothetical protein